MTKRKMKVKKIVTFILVIVMVMSGVIEYQAATGSVVKLFGIHDSEGGHSTYCRWMEKAAERYKKADPAASITKKHSFTAKTFHDVLTRADYVTIYTHGTGSHITLFNENLVKTQLTVDDINNGPSLSRLKVCFVSACASYNIAMAIQKKGAATTIGWPSMVNSTYSARMIRSFNKYFITVGDNVNISLFKSKQELAEELPETLGAKECCVYGLQGQIF